MTYVLQRTPDGGAVVSRQVLAPVATFRDAALAEAFARWLNQGGHVELWLTHGVAARNVSPEEIAAEPQPAGVEPTERPASMRPTPADLSARDRAEATADIIADAVANAEPLPEAPDEHDDPDRDDDEADLAALCAGGPEASDVAEEDPIAAWEARTLAIYKAAVATRPGDAEDAIDAAAGLPCAAVDDPSMKTDAGPAARGDGETARAAIRPAAAPAPAVNDQPPAPDPYGPRGEAFARLRAGEKLGAVADDLGLAMPKLRSAWARSGERAEAPAPARDRPVMDAIDRDAADMRRQPPALARVPERPALPDGWTECPRCRTAFNAEKARRDLRLAERPARCAACRARS